jgi:hypothetical protein
MVKIQYKIKENTNRKLKARAILQGKKPAELLEEIIEKYFQENPLEEGGK